MVFLAQFKDFMVLVLFGATIVSAFREYIDSIAIVAIVIINGILGFFKKERLKSHWKL